MLLLADPAIDLNQTKIHHYGKEDFFFFLCVEVLFLIKLCICGSCGVLQVVLCQSVKHLGPIHRVLKGWREPAAPLFALCSCLICTGWGFCCLLSSNN